MNLSICIPVYNTEVVPLVRQLLGQARDLKDIEIVVLDDGSGEKTRKKNEELRKLPLVVYEELPENIGRAAIRNKLAQKAQGKLLLFLDDDSMPAAEDFLKKYLQENIDGVCCGGRKYPASHPGEEYSLHYQYGRFRESRPADKRAVQPYRSFHSNNFLIRRELMASIGFDESLRQYGHEDSLFAFHLKTQRAPILHIDNPVVHTQLETNRQFLVKTRQALQNLLHLEQQEPRDFGDFIKLLKTARRLRKSGLEPILKNIWQRNHLKWEHHLLSAPKPSMKIYNLYKLGFSLNLE